MLYTDNDCIPARESIRSPTNTCLQKKIAGGFLWRPLYLCGYKFYVPQNQFSLSEIVNLHVVVWLSFVLSSFINPVIDNLDYKL